MGDNVLATVFAEARQILWEMSGFETKLGDKVRRTKTQEDIYNNVKSSWTYVSRAAGKKAKKRSRHASAGESQTAANNANGTPKGSDKLDAPLAIPALFNTEEEFKSFALNLATIAEKVLTMAEQAKVKTGDAGMYMRDFVSGMHKPETKSEQAGGTKNVPTENVPTENVPTENAPVVAPRKRRNTK